MTKPRGVRVRPVVGLWLTKSGSARVWSVVGLLPWLPAAPILNVPAIAL